MFIDCFLEYNKTVAGIEDSIIVKDHQFSSSNHPDDAYLAHEGRLNSPGAWCGNTARQRLFLQIDFSSNFKGERTWRMK